MSSNTAFSIILSKYPDIPEIIEFKLLDMLIGKKEHQTRKFNYVLKDIRHVYERMRILDERGTYILAERKRILDERKLGMSLKAI